MKKVLGILLLAALLTACNDKSKVKTEEVKVKVEETLDDAKEKIKEVQEKVEVKMEEIRDTVQSKIKNLKKKDSL